MEYTTNLNLKKPAGTDPADITDINDNMDTIDSAMYTLNGRSQASSSSPATDLNNCIDAGCYMFNTSTSHTPANYGLCFVISTDTPSSTGTGWVMQIVIDTTTEMKMYMRKNINTAGWTNWIVVPSYEQLSAYNATTATAGTNFTINQSRVQITGTTAQCCISATATSNYGSSDVVATVPTGYRPTRNTPCMWITLIRNDALVGTYPGAGNIHSDGNVYQGFTSSGGLSGDKFIIYLTYSII